MVLQTRESKCNKMHSRRVHSNMIRPRGGSALFKTPLSRHTIKRWHFQLSTTNRLSLTSIIDRNPSRRGLDSGKSNEGRSEGLSRSPERWAAGWAVVAAHRRENEDWAFVRSFEAFLCLVEPGAACVFAVHPRPSSQSSWCWTLWLGLEKRMRWRDGWW